MIYLQILAGFLCFLSVIVCLKYNMRIDGWFYANLILGMFNWSMVLIRVLK